MVIFTFHYQTVIDYLQFQYKWFLIPNLNTKNLFFNKTIKRLLFWDKNCFLIFSASDSYLVLVLILIFKNLTGTSCYFRLKIQFPFIYFTCVFFKIYSINIPRNSVINSERESGICLFTKYFNKCVIQILHTP
jgi:hypothetical protein